MEEKKNTMMKNIVDNQAILVHFSKNIVTVFWERYGEVINPNGTSTPGFTQLSVN